jgi:hypothetical protein
MAFHLKVEKEMLRLILSLRLALAGRQMPTTQEYKNVAPLVDSLPLMTRLQEAIDGIEGSEPPEDFLKGFEGPIQ